MDAHHIINPSESLATVSHHRPLPTLIRQHENRSCCVSLYWRVSPRLGSSFRALLLFLVAFLSCSSLAAPVVATGAHGDRPVLLVEDDLAWTGSALRLDLSPPPTVPQLMPPLQRDDDTTHIHNAPPSKRALDTDPSNASNGDFSIPTAFDSALSNNFTTSCAKFLNSMRQQNDFKNCHPFSLLMQTSSGFFDASKSTLRITQTLDATCGVNATQCQAVMNKYALQMLSPSACQTDYAGDNPTVLEAYNGLIAYMPAYQASCLHDDQGNYCFANAVSNITSPGDAYPFYLPIGQQLPGGSRPTCNSCLRQEMGVFASYSTNTTQPISKTYTSAAQQISIACGSNFIDVKAAPAKSAAAATSAPLTPTITLILMFLLYLFQ